jgi:hypothetical protein
VTHSELCRRAQRWLRSVGCGVTAVDLATIAGEQPDVTPAEALGVIQHHPDILEITDSYVDGKRPTTRNPYAELAVAEAKARAVARIAELENQLGITRLCVMCGKSKPASDPREAPGCPPVSDEYGHLCAFDMTPQEAWAHWRQVAHEERIESDRLRAELEAKGAASVIEWEPGRSYTAAELLRRAIRGIRGRNGRSICPAVENLFGCGNTVARYLCRWAGRDPDTGKEIAARAELEAKGEG